jgi:hypothetical protein
MNTSDKIIMWEKWRDPFGEKDEDDIDQEPYSNFYEDEEDDGDEHDFDKNFKNNLGQKQIKVIATPMGIIPMNENTASGKIFNFWTGHSNFDITKKIAETIEQIDGVECLDIFTRYRFRIAIGKAFHDSDVKKHIQDAVYEVLETYET